MLGLNKDRALTFITCLITIAAIAVVWLRWQPAHSAPTAIAVSHVRDWSYYASGPQRFGPPNSRVTLTVFSDYQCPYCRTLAQDITKLRKRWPAEVQVIYRSYPLSFHSLARSAAAGAICAVPQKKFEDYHGELFADQDSLQKESTLRIAKRVGVPDLTAFASCLTSPEVAQRLHIDSTDAARLGVHGTPTVLINDSMFGGSPGLDTLMRYVQLALRSQTQR